MYISAGSVVIGSARLRPSSSDLVFLSFIAAATAAVVTAVAVPAGHHIRRGFVFNFFFNHHVLQTSAAFQLEPSAHPSISSSSSYIHHRLFKHRGFRLNIQISHAPTVYFIVHVIIFQQHLRRVPTPAKDRRNKKESSERKKRHIEAKQSSR